MTKTVALIGAGAMGGPMADRLRKAGFPLIVCDNSALRLTRFEGTAAKTTTSPTDCAGADIIVVVVANAEQTREVLLGPKGVMGAVPKGRSPIVIVMGTISREAAVEIGNALHARGARMLDAPISGGSIRAEAGTLAIMCGGARSDYEEAVPVFKAMGSKLFHCGGIGDGQAVKIVNNLIGTVNVVLVGEAYRIALESGLTLEQIAPVLEASSGRVNLSIDATEAYDSFEIWGRTTDNVTMVMQKDMHLALEMAGKTSGKYPALHTMTTLIDKIDESTFENWRMVGRSKPPAK